MDISRCSVKELPCTSGADTSVVMFWNGDDDIRRVRASHTRKLKRDTKQARRALATYPEDSTASGSEERCKNTQRSTGSEAGGSKIATTKQEAVNCRSTCAYKDEPVDVLPKLGVKEHAWRTILVNEMMYA